jgi:heme/copper-type cytochrome/quinol oxidase subunit 2
VRRQLALVIAVAALFGLLALAVMFMVSAWTHTKAEMSVHGWIALTLGVLFSLIVGCGLMALVFYSSRRGYDERAHAAQSHREVP